MTLKRHILFFLLIASIPLMGFGSRVGFGCGSVRGGCGGPSGEASTEEAGDGVETSSPAASKSYTLKRYDLGTSYSTAISGSQHYQTNTNLGDTLSQGVTLSDKYQTRHLLSSQVVDLPEPEKLKILAIIANQKKPEVTTEDIDSTNQ